MKTPILILIRLRRFMIQSKLKENRCILIFLCFNLLVTFSIRLFISTFGRDSIRLFFRIEICAISAAIYKPAIALIGSRDFCPIWVVYPLRPKLKKNFFIPFFQKTASLLPVKNASKRTSKLVFFNNNARLIITLCHRMTMLFSLKDSGSA